MRNADLNEDLFEHEAEIIHHYWNEEERGVINTALSNINNLFACLQAGNGAAWKMWAQALLENSIPRLHNLLKVKGLTLAQKEEVGDIIRKADEAVPEQYESPEKKPNGIPEKPNF